MDTSSQTFRNNSIERANLSTSTDYLFGNLVADPAVDGLALALIDLLGVDLGHEGAVAPGLLLALPDGDLLAGLAVQLLAINLGHLDTLVPGLILGSKL